MDSALKVAIVGCGSAGPAAALFLKRAGHDVSIFERAPSLEWIGAGFMLQPTGLLVLDRLGLLAPLVAKGAALSGLRCETRAGKCLMDLRYAEIDLGMVAIGLHRAVLLHHLSQAMQDDGVALHLGREVQSLRDGSMVMTDGSAEGPFDLIVLADGARSGLRGLLGIRTRARCYPWGALWHMGAVEDAPDHLYQVVDGASKMVGLLPTGQLVAAESDLLSLFWSVHCDRIDELRRRGLASWKQEVLGMMPGAAAVLEGIEDIEELTFARYWDVRMRRFHSDSVVVIGDAAHATSPQLGQGVNLGLWDAMVLADCLGNCDQVGAALHQFQRVRRSHLAYYQWATHFLTPFFQSDSRWLGRVRNLGLALAGGIGPLRRQMIYTMAGVKRGFVRRNLMLPAPSTPGD